MLWLIPLDIMPNACVTGEAIVLTNLGPGHNTAKIWIKMARNSDRTIAIKKLQALVRGKAVRKRIAELRKEYCDLVNCLEGDNYVDVSWKTEIMPCLPVVIHDSSKVRKRDKNVVVKKQDETKDADFKAHCDEELASQEITHTNDNNVTSNVGIDDSASGLQIAGGKSDCNQITNGMLPQVCFKGAPKAQARKNNGTDMNIKPVKNYQSDMNATNKHGAGDSCTKLKGDELNSLQDLETECETHGHLEKDNSTFVHDSCSKSLLNAKKEVRETTQKVSTDQECEGTSDINFKKVLGTILNTYPTDKAELIKLREDLQMELLWIQQAIESRKNYLVMKQSLSDD